MTIDSISCSEARPMVFPHYKHYPARITIKHWQLRDLVCSSGVSSEIMYPCNDAVHSLDLSTSKNSIAAHFDFEPRCLQATPNVIAAGGLHDTRNVGSNQKGLFAVTNRNTAEQCMGDLGEYINNAVTLYSKPESLGDNSINSADNDLKAIVCNNDYSLYFVDITPTGFSETNSMKLTSPLNHATISPDRKTVIACGDCSQVMIINSQDGSGSNWKLNTAFNSGSDLGFSAAFHPSGMMFGVGFQDGMARLYDVRKVNKPLTEIKSTRPVELMGAFRCMKFCSGPEDLLFLSEQMHRAHIVDLRDFDNHQVINVPNEFIMDDSFSSSSSTATPPYGSGSGSTVGGAMTPSGVDETAIPIVQSYQQVIEHPHDPPQRTFRQHSGSGGSGRQPSWSSRFTPHQSDNGISGLCWSDYDGGSLVVGTDSGLGVWKVDGWLRRTFPMYSMR